MKPFDLTEKKTSPAPPAPEHLCSIREKYTVSTERVENRPGCWDSTKVTVLKFGLPIYEYSRNYSMMNTFEPFRQLQEVNGGKGYVWKEYALISPSYTSFQVLDLETLNIIKLPPPMRNWIKYKSYDEYANTIKNHPEYFVEGGHLFGKDESSQTYSEGFCPTDFYVPDVWEIFDDEGDKVESPEQWVDYFSWKSFNDAEKPDSGYSCLDLIEHYMGLAGFYCGCIWGDDSGGWKLRKIDLSRLNEGIVAESDPWGYFELPDGRLKDSIDIDMHLVQANLRVSLNMGEKGGCSEYGVKWNTKG